MDEPGGTPQTDQGQTPAATGPGTARRLLLLPALCALCVAVGVAIGYLAYFPIRAALQPPLPSQPVPAEPWVGKSLPAIPQWTLQGEPWRGPEAGRTTVLVFWSTGCGPCLNELAELNELLRDAGPAVTAVGVPMERDADVALCIAERKALSYPQLRDDSKARYNRFTLTLGVRGVPSFWIVDGEGIVRAGNITRVAELRKRLAVVAGR
jgi:hypothetical protein